MIILLYLNNFIYIIIPYNNVNANKNYNYLNISYYDNNKEVYNNVKFVIDNKNYDIAENTNN